MGVYVALLRGINVSGHRMIKMTELQRMCEALGLGRVRTYIQSGNVLFESDEERGTLRRQIEAQIEATFGFDVPVVLRTAAEMEQIVAGSPWAPGEGESLHVALLADAPSPDGVARLAAVDTGSDEYRLVGQEVYLLYRQPSHKSKLSNALLEKKLGVASTLRNWQTVTKLAALARD
ncbi:MAG: cytoplasmic protein [Symbiobacteriaceae bacterium]|nr:cytoplasmic protein [Symbiobacteriaceae bacterium]